jgi:transposase
MLKLPSLGELDQGMSVRIYLCVQPADMRRGFDTLAAVVKEFLKHDPFSGNLFLFVGRGRDRMCLFDEPHLQFDGRYRQDGFRLTNGGFDDDCGAAGQEA